MEISCIEMHVDGQLLPALSELLRIHILMWFSACCCIKVDPISFTHRCELLTSAIQLFTTSCVNSTSANTHTHIMYHAQIHKERIYCAVAQHKRTMFTDS